MAAARAGIEVRGSKQLRRTLKAAGDDLSDLKEAHMAAAQVVAPRGAATAPHRTGKLGASVRPGASKTAAMVRVGRAAVPYANAIHWGWKARNIKAQPWLSAAAQSTEPVWVPIYQGAVDKALAKVEGI